MNSKRISNVGILDCTIRDGGYVNNWKFDKKLVRETYRALSKAGIDFVELGYHGTEDYFDKNKYGAFRFCSAEDISYVCGDISGAQVSLMVDFGKFNMADLIQYKDTPVKMIRIAVHKDVVKSAVDCAAEIKKMGFLTSINLMGFSIYSAKERGELLTLLRNASLDYVYLADSHGSMFPHQIEDFYKPLLEIKHIKLGFHSHNNLQMAFANTFSAIEAGVQIVDSSVFGMGRGAGNLPTEIMLSYLQLLKPERYNVIPILNLIDHYFVRLHRKTPWGYNLSHMLSGIYDCHPDYSSNLIERKEYDVEDIWSILNIIKANAQVGFKKEMLADILKKGFFNKKGSLALKSQKVVRNNFKKPDVKYINRHKDRDFLILANGPSLKDNLEQINTFIDRYDPIVLAANYLGGLFRPHYHAFCNKRRFIDYVDTVDAESKLLVGEYISHEMIREYTDRAYENIYYEDADAPFYIKDGFIGSNCRTVSLILMAVAIIMGAKRIFAVGLDGYMGVSKKGEIHFYPEEDETESRSVLMDKQVGNLQYLEQIDSYLINQGKEGIHIITPTNYTKFYKGIENYISKQKVL